MTQTTNLRDRCLSHFATLGIPLRPESLDVLLTKVEKENLSHLDFLDQLIGEQANARRERSVQRRIREAHFAEDKSLEGFHWKFNPKAFDRRHAALRASGFIDHRPLRLRQNRAGGKPAIGSPAL
jgi:DNA replication protein DnaC